MSELEKRSKIRFYLTKDQPKVPTAKGAPGWQTHAWLFAVRGTHVTRDLPVFYL
jgi:hypothetical protein